jgi:large subunit ribosomal protein L6
MSRIGKQPIQIPKNTTVTIDGSTVTVKGPKGELVRTFRPEVAIALEGDTVVVTPVESNQFATALWGTVASHIGNMVDGVNEPFVKKLIIEGVGYRAEMSGKTLVLSLGFSHKVEVNSPEGLEVTVEKNVVTVSGIDKEAVGELAAKIRAFRKPEPYKGKGIRYENEVIKRKEGKKAV